MKIRKTMALVLAGSLILGALSACGSSSSTTSTADSAAASSVSESTAESAVSSSSGSEASEEEALYEQAVGQTYTVGTDTTFAPFEFEDDNGDFTGIDIMLYDAIAEEMGFSIDWQILGFSASVAALESGQVDSVMAGMSVTDERLEKYDFSDVYYEAPIATAVSDSDTYGSLDALDGADVVVKNGTTSCFYAESIADTYGFNLLYVDESSTMYQYVESGQAAACFDDYPILQYEIARGNIGLTIIADTSDDESEVFPTAMAVMKGEHPELIAAFNEGLARLQADGTYDDILNQFFGS